MKNGFIITSLVICRMQFAFQFSVNNEVKWTKYSSENQRRLVDAFNINTSEVKIYHKIQAGPLTGTVTQHLVNFRTKQVINLENGAIHRFLLL